jgi:hypothetical protein
MKVPKESVRVLKGTGGGHRNFREMLFYMVFGLRQPPRTGSGALAWDVVWDDAGGRRAGAGPERRQPGERRRGRLRFRRLREPRSDAGTWRAVRNLAPKTR